MSPEELKPIVEAWGGVEKFSTLLHVQPRTVYYWLEGKRRIRPMVVNLIRTLAVGKQ